MTEKELREVQALESIAESQRTLAALAEAKSREGTAWQKWWYGGDGGAGARSSHMRVNY